jgi:hypothetical protein
MITRIDNKEIREKKISLTTILPTTISRDRKFLKTKIVVKDFDLKKKWETWNLIASFAHVVLRICFAYLSLCSLFLF